MEKAGTILMKTKIAKQLDLTEAAIVAVPAQLTRHKPTDR